MIKRDGFVLVHKTCETPCLFWYVKTSNRFTKKYNKKEGMCMDSKYESLFTPWKIGNVEIKNRIVMCSWGELVCSVLQSPITGMKKLQN